MGNGPMGNPMHSPLGGPNRMNMNGSMPVNPSQQSPHPQMGNMNMNVQQHPGPPNMMSNTNVNSSSGNITPSSINNSPSTPMSNVTMINSGPGSGPHMNSSNNTIPGSNNGPNHGPTTNSSNMNQNQMPPHGGMPMGPGMYGGPKPMPVSAGKIYPADTPMVFNPQNPNAPPIYPCGICHKEVHDNDQGLLCESGCNFWFHR